jgi:hypothetical protein
MWDFQQLFDHGIHGSMYKHRREIAPLENGRVAEGMAGLPDPSPGRGDAVFRTALPWGRGSVRPAAPGLYWKISRYPL